MDNRGIYCDAAPLPPHAVAPHDIRVVVDTEGHWLRLVLACAHVLKTLVIRGDLESIAEAHSAVALPLLECLSLENQIQTTCQEPIVKIRFDTPNLIYCVVRGKLPISIHFNPASIRHLRTDAAFNTKNWIKLELLQTPTRLLHDLPSFGRYERYEHRHQSSDQPSSPLLIGPDRQQRWKSPIPGYDTEEVRAISSQFSSCTHAVAV